MDHQQLGTMLNNKALKIYEGKLTEAFTNSFNYGTPSTLKTKKNYQHVDVDSIYKAVADKNFGYQERLLELGRLDINNSILSTLPQEIILLICHSLKHFRLNFHDFDQKFIVVLSGPSPSHSPSGSPSSVRKERRLTKPKTWFQ